MNLKGRNFLKLLDYTPEEILYLLDLPPEYWRTFDFGNTSISVFELGERVRARRINDTAHLEALAGERAEDADNALPGSLSLYEK